MPNSDCVRLIEESHWMANYGIVRFLGGELTLYYLFGCFREHSEVMIKKNNNSILLKAHYVVFQPS